MRHHYVPQFLLAPWAEGSKDQKLEVFRLDLPGLPSSRRAPRFTAFENDLYALTRDFGAVSRHDIERRLLGFVDSTAAVARSRMLAGGLASLTVDDRINWARFLMALRVRQPKIIDYLRLEAPKELRRHLAADPEEYEALVSPNDPATMEEWVERQHPGLIENVGLTYLQSLIDNAEVGKKILAMRWYLCRLDGSCHDLILADEPCVFSHGIDAPDQLIALPVSPRAAFIAVRGLKTETKLLATAPSILSVRLNESAVGQARVRLYATDRRPARFIANRLAQRAA